MISLLLVILPVFGLIGAGYLARLGGIVGDRTGDGLSDYVFTLAVPCLLFRTLATAALPEQQPWGYWIAYFGGLAVCWIAGMALATQVFGRSGPAAVACGFAAGQSNSVMVGIPIVMQVYGEAAGVPMALLLGVHLPITMTAATILAEGRQTSPLRLLRALLSHPIILGMLLGAFARPVADAIPQPAWSVINALASTAVPCSLVALGIAMHRYAMKAGLALPSLLGLLKLVIHPAIVYGLAFHVFQMPPAWAGVCVLFAACPCGVNAYLFAERYRDGMAEASTAIALSSLLSPVTVLFWLWLLGVSA